MITNDEIITVIRSSSLSENQSIKMSLNGHLRRIDEVKANNVPSSGAFHDWKRQERWSSFGNDHSIRRPLTKGYSTERANLHQQSVKLCAKLVFNRGHQTNEHSLGHKTGFHVSSTDGISSEIRDLKRQVKTLENERAVLKIALQNERAQEIEKNGKIREQELKFQYKLEQLQKANDCLELGLDNVTLLKSEIKDLKRQMRDKNDELSNLQNTFESERAAFRCELRNERAKLREEEYQFDVQKCQLKNKLEESQRANDCLESRIGNATSLESEVKDLEKQLISRADELSVLKHTLERERTQFSVELQYVSDQVREKDDQLRAQDDEIFDIKNALESERRYFRFELQNQIATFREKNDQFKGNECQLQLKSGGLQRANEDIYIQEEISNSCTTGISNTQRQSVNKLEVRRDDRLFGLMNQLQQKFNEVQGKQKNMARAIIVQHDTILSLRRYHSEFPDDRLHHEMEDETDIKTFQQARDLIAQMNDEFCECISSLKNEKNGFRKEAELLSKSLKCEKDKIEQLEERIECMKYKAEQLNEKLNQQSKEVALYKTVAESNTSVALNKKIQNLDKEMKLRETNVKNYEEEFRKKSNELKERIIFLESDVNDKDTQLSKLRDQQTLKSLHDKNFEESNLLLKNNSLTFRNEVERYNAKIKGLEENLDRTNNELSDKKERLRKLTTERDDLSSQLRDQRRQASKEILKTESDSIEFHKALKNEIQSLEKEMRTKDLDVKYLEELLESRKINIDVLEKKVEEKNNQLLEQSVRHRHVTDSLQAKQSDIEEQNATFKKKNQHLEAEIERLNEKSRGLEETLDRKKKEISETNEQYVKAVKEKDAISSQVCDLRQRTNKTYDSEAESYKTITSLKAELKHMDEETKFRDAKVKNLEKMLENKNIKLGERISQLENRIKEKDDQLSAQSYQHHQVVTRLHEKESELEETIISLKKKILNLEAEVDRSNREKRLLEETLDNKKKEINDTNERYVKAVKEKDAFSSQHNDPREQTFKTYYSEAESNRSISALKVENKNLAEEMNLRDAKVKDLEKQLQSKNRNLEEKNRQLENTIQAKDGQLSAQSNQHQQVVRRLNEEESKLKATIISLEKKINDHESNAQRLVSKINDLEEQLKKPKIVAKAGLKGNIPAMENMIAGLKQELKQTRTKLRDTEAELNETKTRLSKAMGERLTDNNPNITDLGDKNRPTKLAERFAELYDNQWTDAFDIVEKKFDTEEKAIEALLHILQDAMSFCKTKEREQMEELRRVLVFADKTVPRGEAIDIQRLFKENRKAVASSAVENLLHAYEAHIRRSADERIQMAKDVKSYAKECLEICWLMTVQDPPVVFAPLLKKGVPFNNELFRPYTKSGSIVAFVVWPALLLHENGPVLAKGVAQGAGKP